MQKSGLGDCDRRMAGLMSKRMGENFEEWITYSLGWYEREGIALVEKTPEPMKPIRPMSGGRFLACFTRKAQPDFKGTLRGGLSVVFEAKHTDADRIMKSCVTRIQEERLRIHYNLGAAVFILAEVGTGLSGDCFRVSWEVWDGMKERFGHLYMNRDELEPYRCPIRRGVIMFLDGAEECARKGEG